jgi:hypothetical protein
MALKKQEFYEGAALHLLVRRGGITSIRYEPPLFFINHFRILLKYSTRARSPWGFTFRPDEQVLLSQEQPGLTVVIGLICGSDGVAAISYKDYLGLALPTRSGFHVACYRDHGKHYKVSGPDGTLAEKVPPSRWQRLLELEDLHEAS